MTYFYFFALAFAWGSAFLATKFIVEDVDPYYGAMARAFFGLVFFIVLYAVRRKSVKVPVQELWRPWFLSALLIILPFFLLFWGQRFVPSGVGGIFNGTVPIWAFIAGAVILKGGDSFSWPRAAGVLLGVTGILFIMLPKVSFDGGMAEFYGCIALLGMAVSYAFGNVFTKYIMVDRSNITIEGNIFHQYLFAFIVMGIVSLACGVRPPASALTAKTVLAMVYSGVVPSAVAFLLLLELIRRLGAMRASSASYLVPIVALVLDFAATRRVPDVYEFAGIFLIFISLFLIQRPVKSTV